MQKHKHTATIGTTHWFLDDQDRLCHHKFGREPRVAQRLDLNAALAVRRLLSREDPPARVVVGELAVSRAEAAPVGYTRARIAWELERTAMGDGYYGNALRVAKDLPEATADDRARLDRYATGRHFATDHAALQDLAMRIDAAARGGQ